MKRIDLTQSDTPLVALCLHLAGADPIRQKMAVQLLVKAARWHAVLRLLKAIAQQHGHEAGHGLALPVGESALVFIASRDPHADISTLDTLRKRAWVHSDAQATALARIPEAWESETAPITPPSLQHWLNQGLRQAVAGDDLAKVRWWQSHGADVRAQDADGHNAVQAAQSLPMLDWLLAQGAPTDGKRRWDGSAVNQFVRFSQIDLLRRLIEHDADLLPRSWSPLHQLVVLGSEAELSAALRDPQQAHLLTQLEATDDWQRTPITHAASQGSVAKLNALQQAGANLHVMWRDHPLGHWVMDSGQPEAMHWWLAQPGVQVDAPMGGLQDTLLLEAVEGDNLPMSSVLLAHGADPNRYNNNDSCPMNSATSRAMLQLLMAHGGDVKHMGRNGACVWLALPHEDPFTTKHEAHWLLGCTPAEFAAQHTPRMGKANGEDITSAFHVAMIESRESAFGADLAFDLHRSFDDEPWRHIWNADRFGQSTTLLPDGRCIQIGGEHEDGYDPDFFIYNDVIVHTPPSPGSTDPRWDRRVLAYPADVFPPTDHHTATLMGDEIIVIGGLGYPEQRRAGFTPVYVLDIHTLQMRELHCSGDMPGWIYRHESQRAGPDTLEVRAGRAGRRHQAKNTDQALTSVWQLQLSNRQWTRLANDGHEPAMITP